MRATILRASILAAVGLSGYANAADLTYGTVAIATLRGCGGAASDQPCDFTPIPGGYHQAGGANQAYAETAVHGGAASAQAGAEARGKAEISGDNLPVLHAYSSAAGDSRMNGAAEAYTALTWTGSAAITLSLQTAIDIAASSAAPIGDSVDAEGGGYGSAGGSAWFSQLNIYSANYFANAFFSGGEFLGATFAETCAGGNPGLLGSAVIYALGTGSAINATATTTACSPGSLVIQPGQSFVVDANLTLFTNRGGLLDAWNTAHISFDPALGEETIAALQENLSVGAAVPEPGSWAMMLAGFGALGMMLRRSPVRRFAKNRG